VSAPPSPGPAARGIVRLLNTAGGRMLVLAGEVDGPVVDSFHRRYGLEPARIDGIDAGSVTRFSAPAFDLLLDHLEAAERSGRRVAVHRSPQVELLREGTAP
jgi:ABC-type transporter Mla MlaB component